VNGGWDGDWWPQTKPCRPGTGSKRPGRKAFGATWWGAAWVDAIEHRASLDPNRLPRGRSYARTGQVSELEIGPGDVRCLVQGSRAKPYQVRVRVRAFTEDEWARVLDALAAQAGHTAALLDGELLPEVAGDVRQTGLDLLPGAGEVQPRCSCPDWADPCKHAAAACYLVADELDRDPFVLLALRGRDRTEVMAGLRARRRAAAGGDAATPSASDHDDVPDLGVVAREAWARVPAELPRIPAPPTSPGRPTVLGVDPPPGSPVGAEALRALAADAAARAWALAVGERSTVLDATSEEDLARRAASLIDGAGGLGAAGAPLRDLARRADLPGRDLLRHALAWRQGGAEGLAVLVEAWDPPTGAMAPGKAALGPAAVSRRNRVSVADRQLRLGRDGRWYPYRKQRNGWDPDGPPAGVPS